MIRAGILSGAKVRGTLSVEAGRFVESDEAGSLISRDVFRYPSVSIAGRDPSVYIDGDASDGFTVSGVFSFLEVDDELMDPLFSVVHVGLTEAEGDGEGSSFEMLIRHGQLKIDGKKLRIDGDGYTFCFDMLGALASRYTLYAMDELQEVLGLRLLSESIQGKRFEVSVYRENVTRGFGNGDVGLCLSERVAYDGVRLSAREYNGDVDEDVRNVAMTLTGYRKKVNEATGDDDYVRCLVMTEELVGTVRVGKSESGMKRIEWLMGDTFVRLDEV